jgi:hypothetical protein
VEHLFQRTGTQTPIRSSSTVGSHVRQLEIAHALSQQHSFGGFLARFLKAIYHHAETE